MIAKTTIDWILLKDIPIREKLELAFEEGMRIGRMDGESAQRKYPS